MDTETRKTRIAATFTHAKETENTHQYKEDGAPKRIGTIYLKKRFLKKGVPDTILVTVDW